jgi:hypothetical protein
MKPAPEKFQVGLYAGTYVGITFPCPLGWLALTPDEAEAMAKSLAKYAAHLRRRLDREADLA